MHHAGSMRVGRTTTQLTQLSQINCDRAGAFHHAFKMHFKPPRFILSIESSSSFIFHYCERKESFEKSKEQRSKYKYSSSSPTQSTRVSFTMPSDDDKKKDGKDRKTTIAESSIRPSISLHLIRHAESGNNQVYTNARYIYRGGTPAFDEPGWYKYVETHRKADPGLSDKGQVQADALADYFAPHLENQASHPVHIITSPMRRTLETIRPTLQKLQAMTGEQPKVHIIVNGFYHESEGCHIKEKEGTCLMRIESRNLCNPGLREEKKYRGRNSFIILTF
jgi:hypothetical protein